MTPKPNRHDYIDRLSHAFLNPESRDLIALTAVLSSVRQLLGDTFETATKQGFIDHIRKLNHTQLEQVFRKAELATHNDLFRRHGPLPNDRISGRIVATPAVVESPDQHEIFKAVRCFEDFHEGNDPYFEHDFGAVTVQGEKYFFKIDYFADQKCELGIDPLQETPFRVMTIMCADEY